MTSQELMQLAANVHNKSSDEVVAMLDDGWRVGGKWSVSSGYGTRGGVQLFRGEFASEIMCVTIAPGHVALSHGGYYVD